MTTLRPVVMVMVVTILTEPREGSWGQTTFAVVRDSSSCDLSLPTPLVKIKIVIIIITVIIIIIAIIIIFIAICETQRDCRSEAHL